MQGYLERQNEAHQDLEVPEITLRHDTGQDYVHRDERACKPENSRQQDYECTSRDRFTLSVGFLSDSLVGGRTGQRQVLKVLGILIF